jgi:hypothetical protein
MNTIITYFVMMMEETLTRRREERNEVILLRRDNNISNINEKRMIHENGMQDVGHTSSNRNSIDRNRDDATVVTTHYFESSITVLFLCSSDDQTFLYTRKIIRSETKVPKNTAKRSNK